MCVRKKNWWLKKKFTLIAIARNFIDSKKISSLLFICIQFVVAKCPWNPQGSHFFKNQFYARLFQHVWGQHTHRPSLWCEVVVVAARDVCGVMAKHVISKTNTSALRAKGGLAPTTKVLGWSSSHTRRLSHGTWNAANTNHRKRCHADGAKYIARVKSYKLSSWLECVYVICVFACHSIVRSHRYISCIKSGKLAQCTIRVYYKVKSLRSKREFSLIVPIRLSAIAAPSHCAMTRISPFSLSNMSFCFCFHTTTTHVMRIHDTISVENLAATHSIGRALHMWCQGIVYSHELDAHFCWLAEVVFRSVVLQHHSSTAMGLISRWH